jgi:hypothetical protein
MRRAILATLAVSAIILIVGALAAPLDQPHRLYRTRLSDDQMADDIIRLLPNDS